MSMSPEMSTHVGALAHASDDFATEPERDRKIQTAAAVTHSEIEALDAVLTSLINQLEPALTPQLQVKGTDHRVEKDSIATDSSVAQSFNEASSKIAKLRGAVMDTINRLEL